ncbi:hypothetical protein B0H19DRAFT_970260 [Mycena capillaripes]|nr:hypothetical protein B0H19DRAFT_970260 [Mycena capillaripes]
MKKAASHETTLECINYAENAGLYDLPDDLSSQPATANDADDSFSTGIYLVTDTWLEGLWEECYEKRRESLKKSASSSVTARSDDTPPPSSSVFNDGSNFRNALTAENKVPQILQDVGATEPVQNVSVEAHIKKWTLNPEQAQAFRMIPHHSLENHAEQLRMFLSGPGGTGKSRVIQALRDFFDLRGQNRRLRFSAYTGVAARNIHGITIHAALCINQRSSKSAQARTRRDLTAMWEGVNYFFIDEVSMVGCTFSCKSTRHWLKPRGTLPYLAA